MFSLSVAKSLLFAALGKAYKPGRQQDLSLLILLQRQSRMHLAVCFGYGYPYKLARVARSVAAPGDNERMSQRHHSV